MLVLVHPDQAETDQGASGQVEAGAGILLCQRAGTGFALGAGQGAEVGDRQRQFQLFGDLLQRLSVHFNEAGAQRGVARHDGVDSGVQRALIKLAAHAYRRRQVIHGAGRLQLIEEPKALLGE